MLPGSPPSFFPLRIMNSTLFCDRECALLFVPLEGGRPTQFSDFSRRFGLIKYPVVLGALAAARRPATPPIKRHAVNARKEKAKGRNGRSGEGKNSFCGNNS